MEKMNYQEMVNPTCFTAQQTFFMLAAAGNQDAVEFISELDLKSNFLSQGEEKESLKDLSSKDINAIMTGMMLVVEARYNAVSRELMNSNYRSFLDIACGYTPRSIFCYREGIDYVGLDLPAVAETLASVQKKLFKDMKHPAYIAGDATNSASLMKAADNLEGELFISVEGLAAYLSKDELSQFLASVRAVLRKHGGALYSTDFGVDYDKIARLLMDDPSAMDRFIQIRNRSLNVSGVYDRGSGMDFPSLQRFAASQGFRLEFFPLYVEGEPLNMLKAIPQSTRESVYELLDDTGILKMTLDPDYQENESIKGATEIDNLKISYTIDNGVFTIAPSGRIDTLSAPALLELFDRNVTDNVSCVSIDAEKLDYISSAGLRVLMIMVKRLGKGSVVVRKASIAVKDIFETTGFDQIIEIE